MIISNGGIERVLGPHLQKIYKSNSVDNTKAASKSDSITISSEARLMQMASDAVRQLPEVRSAKVEALKLALAGGGYEPSDDDVALSILRGRV